MMTKEGGRRIATSAGAVLADWSRLEEFERTAPELERLFGPAFWAARGELTEVNGGRGAAWFVSTGGRWVLRHYRRGGWAARLSADRYLWTGESRVRAIAEFEILAELARRGLPVPAPVAAKYQRAGLFYRCDLITARIEGALPLSLLLSRSAMPPSVWRAVGAAIGRLHAAGADHADLNAHNVLVNGGSVSVIDFDRGRLRAPGAWAAGNLARLHRSLIKVSAPLPPDRFSPAAWECLLAGYRALPV